MNESHTIPASMIEAAAQAIADKQGTLLDLASGSHVVFDNHRDLARAVLAAALAECEVTEQGIVTGDPGLGYPAYHFVWPIPGGTGGGSGLADAAAFVTANRSQGRHPFPWRDGPHLHRRLLVLTPIEDVTAVDTPAHEETAT